jgi:hypothetical protein
VKIWRKDNRLFALNADGRLAWVADVHGSQGYDAEAIAEEIQRLCGTPTLFDPAKPKAAQSIP